MAESCLEEAEVEITAPPEPVLIMARVRETVDGELFNLGEVLVTRCGIRLAGEPGWSMVPGDDAERALCAAILDAASRTGDPTRYPWLEAELASMLRLARQARRERWSAVQPTRVEFEELA